MRLQVLLVVMISIFCRISKTHAFISRPAASRSLSRSYGSLKNYITKLIKREDLTTNETEVIWTSILSQEADPAVVGALLTLLRAKGETPKEIAGMVNSMKTACNPVAIDAKLLDIVGTGGDGADTINISTASAVLSAACGCKVAKAGNRSSSSKCGSADVLEALGVKIELTPKQVVSSIENCGIGFMYAPMNHPAMKIVAPIRKAIGVRTAFNLLGPLTNAANAERVVIGVFDDDLVDLMANSLMEIGHVIHGVVIHGKGLDEISPLGSSTICEIKKKEGSNGMKGADAYDKRKYEFDPMTVNIPRCVIADLKGGEPDENAEEFKAVLAGGNDNNAKRDAIVLNAGFGNYVYGLSDTIEGGIALARRVLNSGDAIKKLDEWITVTNKV